jgi:hypothetical protein
MREKLRKLRFYLGQFRALKVLLGLLTIVLAIGIGIGIRIAIRKF